MTSYLFALIPLLLLTQDASASKNMVQIRRGTRTGTSTTLIWQTYMSDERQLRNAVEAGSFVEDADNKYAMYICRLSIEGIMTIGQTIKNADGKLVCVLAIPRTKQNNLKFEVLVNIGGGAKLNWTKWDKYLPHPNGAVSEESTGQVDCFYIARHKVEENEDHVGADHLVGRLDTKINLGKVYVVENESEKVISFNSHMLCIYYNCFFILNVYTLGI